MKKDRQRALEILLRDWATWEHDLNGYPASTAESRAGEGHGSGKPSSRPPRGAYAPERVSKTRTEVKRLGDVYPELKLVIDLQYGLVNGKVLPRWVVYEKFKAKTGKGPRCFSEWLGKAHAWLDGRLL